MKLFFSLILLIIVLPISTHLKSDESDNQSENQYLLHAESSEQLLNIMQQISSVADNQQAAEEISFTEEDMTNLVETVEELLFYAELMALKVPANQLEESNSVIFNAMASKLYSEALNIQQLTKSYDPHNADYSQTNLLNEAFTRLSQTCNACHQLFREE
jgi:cytochrome c556